MYDTDLFGTELEKKNECKMFLPKAWCILTYGANYILKNKKNCKILYLRIGNASEKKD